jgi:dynein heavy chain
MFSILHKSVEEVSADMIEEVKRYNYVTPTSYLELIRMYKQVLTIKRQEFQDSIDR